MSDEIVAQDQIKIPYYVLLINSIIKEKLEVKKIEKY